MMKRAAVPYGKSAKTRSDLSPSLPKVSPILDHDLTYYKFLMDSVPMAIVSMDTTLRITGFNHWAEKVTGYSAEQALGRQCKDILRSSMCDASCPMKAVLARVKAIVSGRTILKDKAGKFLPVRFNAAAFFGPEGKPMGAVETFMDISKLVSMEREKANFISMLAHDMRSSLSGIHGLGLRLLRKLPDLDREMERKYLEIITREASTLEVLIDDFLDLSRIETGRLKLNIKATSLDKELEELFETYRVKAAEHGNELELQVENILPVIEADADKLHRVFANLLDNAIKFSGNKGTITITAREKERGVEVTVADHGIGIEPGDIPHIFDVFHRGRSTAETEGHGLGLATVKAIVEGHGGHVFVESQPEAGATFTLWLPKQQAASRSAESG